MANSRRINTITPKVEVIAVANYVLLINIAIDPRIATLFLELHNPDASNEHIECGKSKAKPKSSP